MLFTDRADAGRRLAAALRHLGRERPVVLGLPRGGVPVAFEVAMALGAPLDVIVVRKLGVPYHRELGFGAIGEDDVKVISEEIVRRAGVTERDLASVERAEQEELLRRTRTFRADRPRVPLEGRTVILVDDGIATGATAEAACAVVRAHGAARVVLAVPVAPPGAVDQLRTRADDVVCLHRPPLFSAVGEWYRDFSQTPDGEVVALLARAAHRDTAPRRVRTTETEVMADGLALAGTLAVPDDSDAVVVFAHGSGSSRHSPRNRAVAAGLNRAGFGTLLLDLLVPAEETDHAYVFDIETLARRLTHATLWLRERVDVPVGYFGASTGAAAALRAAADPEADVGAVVSRGGRPDLAGPCLTQVRAPTLLVVGGHDEQVLALNRRAQAALRCENRLEVVPGATHLFEERGALDAVAGLARDWFTRHLVPGTTEDG
ncbi:phosphoribosyltransferase family protein [Streptomyces fulvorobeus]|uniref:Putative phosphoribosyl transferase n=1 Tax=Streptomyces fulvorobeus TaxID=284028 RepID=A0A7J0C6M3_9ACTN|nr:phosphoribosyltransferase family protein [Streptomyces fulvorobeus]NYE41701.1 putative phosphoribosyltransferase/dienelactone hydrolase [Streptomyces fulvorobeus]GFM98069.1 putative phosphoribosyl transferase [Streptomyces fulvorobeus]